MIRSIITSLIILSFFNLILSCKQTEKVSKDEVYLADEKIIAAIYPNGDEISFIEKGAEYLVLKSVLMGKNSTGKDIILSIQDIEEMRKAVLPSVQSSEIGNRKITEVVTKQDRVYKFDSKGGSYKSDVDEIVGELEGNVPAKFKSKNLTSIHIDHPELYKISDFTKEENYFVPQVVIKNSNKLITFGENGAKYVENKSVLSGITSDNEEVILDASEVLYVKIERTDVPLTILATLGVVVGILAAVSAIALATKQSCPFVYAHNSDQYIFDAEPLGGAVTKGLERTDLSKLEHLKETDGKLKLLVRNEVPETQYIDEMSLFFVEHPQGSEVYSDLQGNLHSVSEPTPPSLAIDENGMDLMPFISELDYTFWQTKLPVVDDISSENIKHHLSFTFPKPRSAIKCKLVINAGTSQWGSQMIREMLSLYGKEIDSWYEKVNNLSGEDIEKENMMDFVVREELYYLNILVNNGANWEPKGLIFGGGPLITETKIYELDLEDVECDDLQIKLNPPYGFWTLDYIAVEYDNSSIVEPHRVSGFSAIDYNQKDITSTINKKDGDYYVMPQVGDYFTCEFDCPTESKTNQRTYFLNTNGYYELHLDKSKKMQEDVLNRIISSRGEVVKYALNRFQEWSLTTK
jgi:hypothetical protein